MKIAMQLASRVHHLRSTGFRDYTGRGVKPSMVLREVLSHPSEALRGLSQPRQLACASAFCLSASNSVCVIAPSSSSFFPLAICSAGSLADATDLT